LKVESCAALAVVRPVKASWRARVKIDKRNDREGAKECMVREVPVVLVCNDAHELTHWAVRF
jgi:hypothetical protein